MADELSIRLSDLGQDEQLQSYFYYLIFFNYIFFNFFMFILLHFKRSFKFILSFVFLHEFFINTIIFASFHFLRFIKQ